MFAKGQTMTGMDDDWMSLPSIVPKRLFSGFLFTTSEITSFPLVKGVLLFALGLSGNCCSDLI